MIFLRPNIRVHAKRIYVIDNGYIFSKGCPY